jgi:hypothetical protein
MVITHQVEIHVDDKNNVIHSEARVGKSLAACVKYGAIVRWAFVFFVTYYFVHYFSGIIGRFVHFE